MKTLKQLTKDAEQVCMFIVELTTTHAEKIALLALVDNTMTTVMTDSQIDYLKERKVNK